MNHILNALIGEDPLRWILIGSILIASALIGAANLWAWLVSRRIG